MEHQRLSGQIDQLLWNGIMLKQGEARRFIELPASVAPRFTAGQDVRLLFRNKRLVRIFNLSSHTLYETDFFADKPLWRKYQIVLFLLVAIICGIPAVGALFGLVLVGVLIGTTFRRSEEAAIQVALVSTVTALAYVGLGGYLLMTGQYWLAFLVCTTLVFCALLSARTIKTGEALQLNQKVMNETV